MDRDRFWDIIAESRAHAKYASRDGIMDEQVERLTEILSDLPPQEVLSFDHHVCTLMNESYSWDLWGAAYIIGGGCSDDAFDYFRYWLISMGRKVYDDALADVESLAVMSADPTVEAYEFEEFGYVAASVYGDDFETDASIPPHPSEPSGEPWDEEDLPEHFPRLAAAYDF